MVATIGHDCDGHDWLVKNGDFCSCSLVTCDLPIVALRVTRGCSGHDRSAVMVTIDWEQTRIFIPIVLRCLWWTGSLNVALHVFGVVVKPPKWITTTKKKRACGSVWQSILYIETRCCLSCSNAMRRRVNFFHWSFFTWSWKHVCSGVHFLSYHTFFFFSTLEMLRWLLRQAANMRIG